MMFLVTGGSANGKSVYAEQLCLGVPGQKYYIAAMRPFGKDAEERIRRHRVLRAGKGFETIERYTDLESLRLPERGTALLECVGNLTANEMFDEYGNVSDPEERVLRGIRALSGQCERLVVVTNEIGSGGVRYEGPTEEYIRVLGRINSKLAEEADVVIETVAGIPIFLKGAIQ